MLRAKLKFSKSIRKETYVDLDIDEFDDDVVLEYAMTLMDDPDNAKIVLDEIMLHDDLLEDIIERNTYSSTPLEGEIQKVGSSIKNLDWAELAELKELLKERFNIIN